MNTITDIQTIISHSIPTIPHNPSLQWLGHYSTEQTRLVVRLKRTNNKTPDIQTNMHLPFDSHHPSHHKFAVARTLFNRADKIWSFSEEILEEVEHATSA